MLKRCRFLIHLWLLAVSFLTVAFAHAESSPLLWKVSSKSSSGHVYLFGSIHFGETDMYPLPDRIIEAYEASDALAVELDVEAIEPARIASLIATQGRFPSGTTLKRQLEPAMWSKLVSVCEDLQVDHQQFLELKPWLVAVQLVTLQLRNTDYRQALGIDRYFLNRARGAKPIVELESLEEQLAMFGSFSDREQRTFLQRTLAEYDQGEAFLEDIARAWRAGDRQGLEHRILSAFRGDDVSEAVYRRVFSERNERMAAAAAGFLRQNRKIFLVAGVGHMLGAEGIVEQLRRQGYTVELIAPATQTAVTTGAPSV